ncbi:MAG: vWA domain-containing protein [Thermodesulfobacteriota bacterium]
MEPSIRSTSALLGEAPRPGADIPPDVALSSFWRKNSSTQEPTELANLLRALRKVAGHLGPNVGRIEYLGMSHGDPAAIVVDPAMVMGQYPVPGKKTDYLVGLVVHEALLQMEWSERVFKNLLPDFRKMPRLALVIFQKLVQTGESIYVDRIADRTILGRYVEKTRGRALMEASAKLRTEILTVDALLYLWWVGTWGKNIERLLEPVYEPPLIHLRGLSEELRHAYDRSPSVTDRAALRADLYRGAWQAVGDICLNLTLLDRRLVWHPDELIRVTGHNPERRITNVPRKVVLSANLAREIEATLAVNSADITPIIRGIVGHDNPDVAPTSRWDFNIPAHPVVDRRMVARLSAVFTQYARRKKIQSRGLTSGRVDRRRLWRAPVNGRCFSQTDTLPVVDWNVTLLLDATGSMRGNKWRMVENTVGNLHRALLGFPNRLSAYAYFEIDGICMISRLIQGKKLLSVPPAGQTASGQAILAAAYFMPRDARRKVMIHVTDGESNFGVDVQVALDFCRREKISLITLGCGVKDKKLMTAQYGKSIQFLQSFGQLPQAVERLLKWTFLYGTDRQAATDRMMERILGERQEKEENGTA